MRNVFARDAKPVSGPVEQAAAVVEKRAALAAKLDDTVRLLGSQLAEMARLDRELATCEPGHHEDTWPTGLDARSINGVRMVLRDAGLPWACPSDGNKAPSLVDYIGRRDSEFLAHLRAAQPIEETSHDD